MAILRFFIEPASSAISFPLFLLCSNDLVGCINSSARCWYIFLPLRDNQEVIVCSVALLLNNVLAPTCASAKPFLFLFQVQFFSLSAKLLLCASVLQQLLDPAVPWGVEEHPSPRNKRHILFPRNFLVLLGDLFHGIGLLCSDHLNNMYVELIRSKF